MKIFRRTVKRNQLLLFACVAWAVLGGAAGVAHAQLPGSRLEVFPDAGHIPQLESPGRFAATLQRFLDETEAAEFDGAEWRARLSGR